jgi:hypothetical protein
MTPEHLFIAGFCFGEVAKLNSCERKKSRMRPLFSYDGKLLTNFVPSTTPGSVVPNLAHSNTICRIGRSLCFYIYVPGRIDCRLHILVRS